MMRFLRWIFPVAAVLALGCATPIEQSRWIRVKSAHFELVSGAGQADTVEIAGRLELLRAVLQLVGLQANLEPRVPLLVYVFPDPASYARFSPRSDFPGFMLPRTHRNFLVVQAGGESDAGNSALHEYVHFVLRNGAATRYPAWYDEGLAEFLSTVAIQGDQVVIGTIPRSREHWLLYGSPMSLRQMMTVDEAYDDTVGTPQRFYAQAWTLAHFFHVADRIGFPKRRAQLTDYIARLNQGEPPDQACQNAFGTDFESLDKEFTQYLSKGRLPYLGVAPERLAVPQQIDTRSLPETGRDYLLGDLALALGKDWRGEAELWFRLGTQADPQNARAWAALARTESDRQQADADFARALSLAPNDPEVQRHYGEAMLARAEAETGDRTASIELARGAFRRSIQLEPQQVAAYAGLGRSHVIPPVSGDPAEGLGALRIARERLPTDDSIALDSAKLEVRAGSPEKARAILARLSRPTHGDPLVGGERERVGELRVAAGLPAQEQLPSRQLYTRLEIELPRDGEQVRGLSGWVMARGQGGLWETPLQDVIIAIDESPSTFLPCGTDLDGDGKTGTRTASVIGGAEVSTDPDDSVLHAELLAARVLIRQLDPLTTRVGIVTFSDDSSVLAPLGTPDAALAWLDDYEIRFYSSRTSLATALDGSLKAFFEFREPDKRRQRTVLLLSDGHPTDPSEAIGRLQALAAADRMGEAGIPVNAYALGKSAIEDPDFFRSLAERTGGKFVPLEKPAEVVTEFANIRFTGLQNVEIQSSPIGQPGRAVRVFPNGSFDGYVPLAEGENQITITGVMEDGQKVSSTRTVYYERPKNPTPADELAAQQLKEGLQDRMVEIELMAEMRRASPSQVRKLTVEADKPGQQPAKADE